MSFVISKLKVPRANSIVVGIDHITTTRTTTISPIIKIFTTILVLLFFFVVFVIYRFPLIFFLFIFLYIAVLDIPGHQCF